LSLSAGAALANAGEFAYDQGITVARMQAETRLIRLPHR